MALLASIRTSENKAFPAAYTRFSSVRVESNPNGDSKNRVDIDIDTDNFFLLIEVKIDAFEQDKQIERYCSDAKKSAGERPWGVVFLTRQGRPPVSGGSNNKHYISCLSWRDLARDFETGINKTYRKEAAVQEVSVMK